MEGAFDPCSQRSILAIGPRRDWRCLDVGGGGGSMAEWLCRVVAPDRVVVATDLETGFLEVIDAPNLEVRQHNIISDPLEEGAFGLVHSRAVLDHLPERDAVLGRLLAALRPGGWLTLDAADFSSVHAVGISTEDALFFDESFASAAVDRNLDHGEFVRRCRNFYSQSTMAEIDDAIHGWSTMASHLDGITLWHTTAALTSLQKLDEYKAATQRVRDLMDWSVLLHDLAKEPGNGRDHPHAFRSAAAAGRVLPRIGFNVTKAWKSEFETWFTLTDSAHRFDSTSSDFVQDNDKLAAIISGADRLYGEDSAIVLKAIAHTSP